MRLCNAAFGSLYVLDGEHLRSVAQRGVPAYADYRAAFPPSSTGGIVADLSREKRPIHVLDMKDRERYRAGYPDARAIVDVAGARTTALIPLVKDDTFLGYISIFRQEVQAFSDKQIALLQNFAAQAVIAMENARLINEQRRLSSNRPLRVAGYQRLHPAISRRCSTRYLRKRCGCAGRRSAG
jgi:GAF domain-containing protein